MAMPSSATPTASGTIKGLVSMAGRGIEGLSLTLVNLDTGKAFSVKTSIDGAFTALVPAGSYVFSSPGRSGVSISRAPLSVEVVSGRVASASVEVASLAFGQDPAVVAGTATITHDGFNCITEGEFTLVEAVFAPLASIVNGRLYFQSNLSPEWFYTEFEKIEPPVANGPTHRAFIPKVNKDGGIETINYYIQVTSSDFAETKSPENSVKIVSGAGECKGFPGVGGIGEGLGKLGPIGAPEGAVSVLSASGSVAGSLAGFGGVAGATLGAAAVVGAAAAVAVGGAVAAAAAGGTAATPTPAPTATPATPTPTPAPTPPPATICNLTVVVSPDIAADPSVGGRFCTAFVTTGGVTIPINGAGTLPVPCSARVDLSAFAANQSSLLGPLPATWSNSCSGSALGSSACFFNPMAIDRLVGLTCSR